MTSDSDRTTHLAELERIATDLEANPGQVFLAHQIRRAVHLARALPLENDTSVLVVNPSLGDPWPIQAMRACGCAVTVLCENARLLGSIEAEHAGLMAFQDSIPGLGDFLSSTAASEAIEFRSGHVSLFFPEEDSYNVICLLAISKGEWGFGPDAILHNSLRGLREGGTLLAGFLDSGFSDPATVEGAAAAGGFFLTCHATARVPYDAYAPDGLLFTLTEKTGRSVDIEIFESASEDLDTLDGGDLNRILQEALRLAQELEITKGCRIFVIGRTPDLWIERVLAGVAGRIDIVLTEEADLDEAKSEFSFFPGIVAVDGGLELQTALRNPNNRIYNLGFLRSLAALKSFDLICFLAGGDAPATFETCLRPLVPGGRLIVAVDPDEPGEVEELVAAAGRAGCRIEFKRMLDVGSLRGALFARSLTEHWNQ